MGKNLKNTKKSDVLDVLKAAPNLSAEEVATALGVARSTAHKRLASAIAEGSVERQTGGREGRRKLPDRYTAVDPAVTHAGTEKGEVGSSPAAEGRRRRLRPGELDGLVLAYIADHRDKAPFGPTAVARALARSAGAVGNTFERLAERGEVARVGERPRCYGPTAG